MYFTSGKLKNDFKKNPDNFETKLIATFDTIEEARDYELKQTQKIIKNKRYANIASHPQIIHTGKIRRKIGLSNKGNIVSEEHRRKISEVRKGSKGMKFSEETKRKMVEVWKIRKERKALSL